MLSFQPMLFDARIQRQCVSLREAGYSVTVLYVEDLKFLSGIKDISVRWEEYDAYMHDIKTVKIFLRSKNVKVPVLKRILQFGELFWKAGKFIITNKFDICQSNDLQPGIFALLSKVIHRSRIVYDSHELEVRSSNTIMKFFQRIYETILIRFSNLVLTVNETISRIISDYYKIDVHVIGNRPLLREVDPTVHERRYLSSQTKNLLYVGYVQPKKRGIELVINAMKYLREDIHFYVLAVGRLTEFKTYIDDYATSLGVSSDRIKFLEPVNHSLVLDVVHEADISIMLIPVTVSESYNSCAPNKFYESVIAGVPVLATKNNTFPELIYQNGIGKIGETVNPNDETEVSLTINEMLKDENQKLYKQNANLLKHRYSWETESQSYIKLYSQLN